MSLCKITSVMLSLTHTCNLACRYCFVHQEPEHMTLGTAKDAVHFLIANCESKSDTPEINFFGGEPLLMWDSIIKPLTIYIREELNTPFKLSMTSNGILLNEEKLEFMKKYNMGFLFSIDGNKDTQDYNRPFHDGTGSFDKIKPIIPLVLKYYPQMLFRMTLIPATCHHMFENIQFAETCNYRNFFVIPNVFEEWNVERREILQKEMRKYSEYYIQCFRNGKIPMQFSAFEEALRDIKIINSAVERKEFRTLPSCKAEGKCGLGASKFASIHPNGSIYSCQELTSNEGEESIFYIGNIYSGVDEAAREYLSQKFNSEIVRSQEITQCETCKYNRICQGWCVANNYLLTGSMTIVPDVFCFWKRLLIDEAIYATQILGEERNEMFKRRWEVNINVRKN